MDSNVQINIRKTCRTCLKVHKSRRELISIFNEDNFHHRNVKFSEMLTSVSNHRIHEHDAFPKRICVMCCQAIRMAFYFKIQAEDSYNYFKNHAALLVAASSSIIKQENGVPNGVSGHHETSEMAEIDETSDMLVEIETPRFQEQFNGHHVEEEDSDNEIIDYEPSISEDDDDDCQPSTSVTEKSPDSGINEGSSKNSSSPENSNGIESHGPGEQLLECKICFKFMVSEEALRRHKKSHCASTCKYCRRRFGNSCHLRLHTKFKHPDKYNEFRLNGQSGAYVEVEPLPKLLVCKTCDAKFCEKEALYRHHADCDKECIECGLKIPQKGFYFRHLAAEHNIVIRQNPSLECPFGCAGQYSTEKILQEHINRTHPENNDEESIADTISESNESASNDTAPLISCQICQSRPMSEKGLKVHMALKHSGEIAPVASVAEPKTKTRNVAKYTREEFIEKFMVRKSNEYLRCVPCKKDIHRRSLMVHVKGQHASVYSFFCELCPEGFFRIDYRQRHMKHMHRFMYRCTTCDIQYDRAYKYDAHMVLHGVKAKNFKPEEFLDRFDLSQTNMKFIEDSTTYDYDALPRNMQDDAQRRTSIASTSSSAHVEHPMTKEEFVERYIVPKSDHSSHCTVCQQDMKNISIVTHMLWKHAITRPLKCAFCNERVVKHAVRLSHMSRCHPREYRCEVCDEQFAKHKTLAQHVIENHQRKVSTLPSSGEEKDLTLGDMKYVATRSEDVDVEVIEEPEVICIEPEAAKPVNATHQCRSCPRSFASAKNLLIHKSHKHKYEANTSNPLIVAALDDASEVMNFEDFRNNFVEGINNLSVKCLVCDQVLRKRNLANHVKSRHATIGAYKCAICPDSFFRPEHRIQHMSQVHRGMFYCHTCNIQFYRNSRYALHMKSLHGIEVDATDSYEVDLNLDELLYVATIKKYLGDEPNASAVGQEQAMELVEEEPEEAEPEQQPEVAGEQMNRDTFLERYIKILGKESRRCLACDKMMLKGSMYNHLMRYHATIQPFKCPFCELRLERAPHRIKHIQMFHPNEYKCKECGIQFQKHAKYSEHMLVEHNEIVKTPKAPGEEVDLSSLDIMYVVHREGDDNFWQDDDNSMTENASAANQEVNQGASTSAQSDDKFLKPKVKDEPIHREATLVHSIFGSDEPLQEENSEECPAEDGVYSYFDFKNQFTAPFDSINFKCLPCNKAIAKTSACAHFRLWHAITMSYNCELCPIGFQRSDYRFRHMSSAHPNDFKCNLCDTQFYRSVLYKSHMKDTHHITMNMSELKTKDEIDVPLEQMKFKEHVPDSVRLRDAVTENQRKRGRKLSVLISDPIRPEAGGLVFLDFLRTYIKQSGTNLTCTVCDTRMTKFSVKKHLKSFHATSKPFNCELCNGSFQKQDERMKHMALIHTNDLKCFQCNEQFYISEKYVEHMQVSHGETVTVKSSKRKSDIDVPIERLRFVPEITSNSSFAKVVMRTPKESFVLKTPKNIFSNISDDIELTREQFYGKFYRSVKGKGILKTKCLACGAIFSSKNRMFHAHNNHATCRPFKCEICPRKFFFLSKRVKHMRIMHQNEYNCHQCSQQFDRAHLYAEHMKIDHQKSVAVRKFNEDEITIPSFKMRYTKKITSVRKLKQQQQRGDNGEEEMSKQEVDETAFFQSIAQNGTICNVCNEDFYSSRALRIHLRNHASSCGSAMAVKTETEPKLQAAEHACDICEKKFYTRLALGAHKNFKHKTRAQVETKKKSGGKIKYEVDCDICDFTSSRRDYIEHHVKAAHKTEFHCSNCTRILSSYNLFLYHLYDSHPRVTKNPQQVHKCEECEKQFRSEENLKLHKTHKHTMNKTIPDHHCVTCGVTFEVAAGYESHINNYVHKAVQAFMDSRLNTSPTGIKYEPKEIEAMQVATQKLEDSEGDQMDPFECLLKQALGKSDEPATKRAKLTPDPEPTATTSKDDDKLDYLKYLQCVGNNYKCGICGKEKSIRKYMLHHLKQHKEVPTYDCHLCPEQFVFRKKYEKHVKSHENGELLHSEENDAEEHPKFQETSVANVNEIKCHICNHPFKLTIMLNRHNSQWHADDNPDKHLSISDQKANKDEPKSDQTLEPIKLLRCKHCLEAFIRPLELKEHLKQKHDSESVDQPMDAEPSDTDEQDDESEGVGSFACDRCKFVFKEQRFLENHKKMFCVHRQTKNGDEVINEQ